MEELDMSEDPPLPAPATWRQRVGGTWPVVVALIAIVVLNFFVADSLTVSILPTEFLFEDESLDEIWIFGLSVLPVAAAVLWICGLSRPLRYVAIASAAVLTLALLINAFELVYTLDERAGTDAYDLLFDAGLVWVSNVVIFSVWYWLLDAGGPERRRARRPERRDFLFPQQAQDLDDYPRWTPNFVDYLFVSFCSCTAFSPADTATLSHRAKLLQVLQAGVSLAVLAMIAARAINIIEAAPKPPA
jgi:hypothetical protein